MSGRYRLWPLPIAFLLLGGLGACGGHAAHAGSSSPTSPTAAASATPAKEQLDLDALFSSPTGKYTLRVNHSWKTQPILNPQAGFVDFFSLVNANFSVASADIIPGTTLDAFVQSEIDQYQKVKIQGLERMGTIDVGGGRGTLIKARTFVDSHNITVFSPPAPDSKARTLYQAFYISNDVSYTFSIAWQEGDRTDYLGLFHSILRTFTLAGAS